MGMGTSRCGYGTYEENIICLKILESSFLKKRWFLEHLELIYIDIIFSKILSVFL